MKESGESDSQVEISSKESDVRSNPLYRDVSDSVLGPCGGRLVVFGAQVCLKCPNKVTTLLLAVPNGGSTNGYAS